MAAVLALILAHAPSVLYAEQSNVTIDTDRRFYREGDIMQVYGEVNEFREGFTVNIKILASGNILFSVSVLPEFDQQTNVAKYSYSFPLISENLVTGDYMIIAEYQNDQASKRVAILKSFDLEYTNSNAIDILVKNHRLSKVSLSSISLLLEDIRNPSFSFPEGWEIGVNVNEGAVQLHAQGFELEPDEEAQFSIRSESFLLKEYDLCWSSYGSSISIWLCNPVAIQDNVQNEPEPKNAAEEQQEKSKENIAKKIMRELKMPGIEALVVGYSFDIDTSDIESEIKDLLEKDAGKYYPVGSTNDVYYGANVKSTDANLYLKSNDGKLNFTIYIDDLSIENGYVDINLDKVKIDGYALYNEDNAKLKVTIPPQGAFVEILKAILHL